MRVLWLLVAVGCVPKGRYEITRVQLDATRTALSAQTARQIADGTAADQVQAELRMEIDARQAQLDELTTRVDSFGPAIDRLEQERLELLDELARLRADLDAIQQVLAKKKPPPPPPVPGAYEQLARDDVRERLAAQAKAELGQQRLDASNIEVLGAFIPLTDAGRVQIEVQGDAVVVRIPTGQLFQEGFTTLSPRGQALMTDVVGALGQVPGRTIAVEGHTDNRKVHTAEFPSNWERGFSNALTVLRTLQGGSIDAKLSAASFAGTRPLAANDTPEGRERNERIELRVALDPELPVRYPPSPPPEPAPEAPASPDPVP